MIVVKPVIEVRFSQDSPRTAGPYAWYYDKWASALSEGWCPNEFPSRHRVEPFTDPKTGEQWLYCKHGDMLYRLVYPNEIEQD